MTGVRHMALWLAAVIVLIAVGLMPSGAQAHASHPHAAARVVPVEIRIGSEARGLIPEAVVRTAVGLVASPVDTLTTGLCDGSCCNAGCRTSCCTGSGLAPDSADAAGPRGPGARALARALPARTDVIPEALPEPPRFDA